MHPLAEQVVRTLAERGLTIAVAEADTGGLIGDLLTDVPGSSRVFPGGVIAYGNRPKRDLLGIPAALFQAHGAVSAEAAAAMAEGARRAIGTEIGIAATGTAGPSGGSAEKPIGTVFIAYAGPGGPVTERYLWTPDLDTSTPMREQHKRKTALAALELVLRSTGAASLPPTV